MVGLAYEWSHFDDTNEAPALELAQGTSFHDLHLITRPCLILFVVSMNNGLPLNFLLIQRVWNLVFVSDLDGLVTGTADNDADEVLAAITV